LPIVTSEQQEVRCIIHADDAGKAEHHADDLINDAGLTKVAVLELASQVKGVEIDPVEHVALLSRVKGEGVEIQEFFADAVEGARTNFSEADSIAIEAAGIATASLQKLNNATLKLREAENALEKLYMLEREVTHQSQRSHSDARNKREHADHAKRRVDKV
jgi:hypothetical protein